MSPTRSYHWFCLLAAILLEVGGSITMKLSQQWDLPHAALLGLGIMWLCIGLSYYYLALSTTGLPVGVAFAFWEGLGLTLVTLAGFLVLGERPGLLRLLGLCCVLGGALLVHKGTSHGDPAPAKEAHHA
ncbi:SMR family transporter [uncultured Desulfovibrio sp.]|uniref:DMT family transporter n=1 Tax=uncultured Desulfovibrio sp. TaxID=167968 RepID=UPI002621F6EF|nr:SMR family transporter [uncultured Desulfovibrio sp.]